MYEKRTGAAVLEKRGAVFPVSAVISGLVVATAGFVHVYIRLYSCLSSVSFDGNDG